MAICYVVVATLSLELSRLDHLVAGFWAANIVAYAIMARNESMRGLAAWIGVFAGSMVFNMGWGTSFGVSLLFAVTAACYQRVLLWLTLQLLGSFDSTALDIRGFLLVLLSIVGVSAVAGLLLGVMASALLNWPFFEAASSWSIAEITGAALFLPFAFYVSRDRLRGLMELDAALRVLAWAGGCGLLMLLAVRSGQFAFAYAMIPLLIAAARLPAFELSIVSMVAGLCAMWTIAGGDFMQPVVNMPGSRHGFQIALAINIVLPFFGALLAEQISRERRRIAGSEERFRRAMYDSSIGMHNIDLSGRIVEANPAFAEMLGYQLSEVEGRKVQEFTPVEDLHLGTDVMDAARRGDVSSAKFQKRYRRRDGELFWVEISASLIRSQDTQEPQFLVSQIQDINARKNAEAKLAEMEDRWDFALASAGQGFWDHNVSKGSVTYSTTWTSMLGYGKGELDGGADMWLNAIHPDDVEKVKALDLDHQAGRVPFFELEYRMRSKSGDWVWVLDRGKVVERDANGNFLRMIGTLTDISLRKKVEQDLSRTAALLVSEKERLRVTLESIGDAVICTDAADRITFMNTAAEALTGVTAEDGIGKMLPDVYVAKAEDTSWQNLNPTTGNSRKPWHGMVLMRGDGTRLNVREVVSPIVGESGEAAGNVIVFQDFTDMRELQLELERAAAHDELTGLANRASFMNTAENLHASALSVSDEHQLMFIDLDRFKAVNDSSGHAAGDALLRLVAGTIQSTVRSIDIVARIGGDEFGVILRGCPPSYARLVAQKIVERVGNLEFAWGSATFKIGASIGLATLNGKNGSVDEVIARADEACYAAKAGGRGCVWAPEPRTGKVVRIGKPRPVAL